MYQNSNTNQYQPPNQYPNQYPNPNMNTGFPTGTVKNIAGKVMRVVSIIFLAVCIIMLSIGSVLLGKYSAKNSIVDEGYVTIAYVTALSSGSSSTVTINGETTVYCDAIAEYNVDGKDYSTQITVDKDTSIGDAITIYYDEDNPENAVAENDSSVGLLIGACVLLGLGGIFLLIGIILLIVSIVVRKKKPGEGTTVYYTPGDNMGNMNNVNNQPYNPNGYNNQTPWEK